MCLRAYWTLSAGGDSHHQQHGYDEQDRHHDEDKAPVEDTLGSRVEGVEDGGGEKRRQGFQGSRQGEQPT